VKTVKIEVICKVPDDFELADIQDGLEDRIVGGVTIKEVNWLFGNNVDEEEEDAYADESSE
jgi:hypothetical protein